MRKKRIQSFARTAEERSEQVDKVIAEARRRAKKLAAKDGAYADALAKNPNQQLPEGPGRATVTRRYAPLTSSQHVVGPKRKRPAKEPNVVRCPVFHAVPGEPCLVVVDGRFVLQKTTHISQAKAKAK